MNATAPALNDLSSLTLNISQEIRVHASLETTFAALLEEIGPANQGQDGTPMPMILEPRPGGRWYRDLGNENGHLWGHVQSIKRPSLLEIVGPLFMSYPVASNVQYRLTESDGITTIKFRHSAFGLIEDQHKAGVSSGWGRVHDRLRARAEGNRSR